MDPTSSVIMLAGIYYGSLYGGSITSILVNIPGEAASVVTCIDGYQMARQGRAGAALGIAAFGSFLAGTVATLGISLVGPSLGRLALGFGPAEFTALVVLGLVLVTRLGQGSVIRSLMMVGLGLLLSTVGLDPILGTERFTFGSVTLGDGLEIAVLAMGLFGIAEVLTMAGSSETSAAFATQPRGMRELLPDREDWRRSAAPIARGSVLGFLLGLLPGGGGIIASFASYVVEKRLARHPERFGHGAIEGVAGPEGAHNAGGQAAFVPLLTLGLPANVVMAILMGALMIHGVVPGPMLMKDHPDIFWAVVTSMYIGNVMLVVLNVPLISVFVAMLRVPYAVLAPLIILFCVLGAFSLNSNPADVATLVVFGVLGYVMRRVGFDAAPLLLAFVLGGILERSLRQSLLLGLGSPALFVQRPVAATLLAVAALLLLAPVGRRVAGTLRSAPPG